MSDGKSIRIQQDGGRNPYSGGSSAMSGVFFLMLINMSRNPYSGGSSAMRQLSPPTLIISVAILILVEAVP